MTSYFTDLMQPCGIISITFSASVLITVAVFPSIIKNKIFMQIIALISLSDLLGNWPYAIGYYPSQGTALCILESICNLFFFPASWMLTALLTKQLRDVLIVGKITMPRIWIGLIGFGIPLMFLLFYLAISTHAIGGTRGVTSSSATVCTFYGPSQPMHAYHIITYDGLLYLCIIFMLVMLFQVLSFEYKRQSQQTSVVYRLVKKTVILYPLALICCWTPHAVCVADELSCNFNSTLVTQTDTIKVLHGAVVALIFFFMSSEARYRWYNLLFKSPTTSNASPRLLQSAVSIVDSSFEDVAIGILPDDDALIAELAEPASMPDLTTSPISSRTVSVATPISPNARLSLVIAPATILPPDEIMTRDNTSFSHPRLDGL